VHVLKMLRLGGLFGVLCDAPDGNAGGGSATQTADPTGGVPDGGDASAGDADGGDLPPDGDDALDDDHVLLGGDDDDEQFSQRPLEEQRKALLKSNRRLKSRLLKARTLTERFKGVDIDNLVSRARQFEQLERAARANPRLRALLSGDADPEPRATRRAESDPDLPPLPTAFTAETLGFDPDASPANKVAANLFAHVARLQKQVADLSRLQPTVQSLERTVTSRTAAEERSEWNAALTSLESELKRVAPGNALLVTLGRDAIIGAYNTRAQHGRTAKQVVQGYIERLTNAGAISKKQAGQVSVATQSRMAAHNATLPKSPAGGGTPSSAQGNQRLTLKDVHRKLRQGLVGPR
jgi:hypothetical protein